MIYARYRVFHRDHHATRFEDVARVYDEDWHCPPPTSGEYYRVTSEEWNADRTERQVYAFEIADPDGSNVERATELS